MRSELYFTVACFLLMFPPCQEGIKVFVGLDEQARQQLARDAPDTNQHSLRSLWEEEEDFWDIQVDHKCAVRCEFSVDDEQRNEAAAIIISAQMFPGMGAFERFMSGGTASQLMILWSTEAHDTYRLGPQLPVLAGMFDLRATYELSSDVPLVQGFPSWISPDDFRKKFSRQRKSENAIFVASNCRTTSNCRTEYAKELMKHTEVHSYGRCLNNRPFPPAFSTARRGKKFWLDKVRILQNYTFALVFENSNMHDYVTEKLFQALLAGCIPIYMGAPNVRDFLPADNAAILVSEFKSAEELASHMEIVARNRTLREEMLSWREKPLPDSFLRLWNLSWDTAKCRICELLAGRTRGQPRARIQAHALAIGDSKLWRANGCAAEDAGRFDLARKLYSLCRRLEPNDETCERGMKRCLKKSRGYELIVRTEKGRNVIVIPRYQNPTSLHRTNATCSVKEDPLFANNYNIHVPSVMHVVDEFCILHQIEFGPKCQAIFTEVGNQLVRNGMQVERIRMWEASKARRANESLCDSIDRSYGSQHGHSYLVERRLSSLVPP